VGGFRVEAVMFGIGLQELLVVLLLLVLIFGASRLSDLGKGLGEGIRNFKKGMKGEEDEKKS
jgi:sec-independent protein translocase protein TatA